MHNQIRVIAPATTANLGPGFDVFGLALNLPYDTVTLTTISKGVKIQVAGIAAETIPTMPKKNTAGIVASYMLKQFKLETGIAIQIDKGIAPGMGLGSSGAPAAAVAFGLNRLFNLNLSNKELVQLAAQGEIVSAGYPHADNVSAAIYGDFIIVRSYSPLEVINLKAPENLEVCVAYPHILTPAHKTKKARSVVPKQVSIEKLVSNVGSAAALASGFCKKDVDLIGASMSDAIIEPERAALIPGYQQVKMNAMKAGACGVAISGAGPSMIAIINRRKADAIKVAEAMKNAFESAGFTATAFATAVGRGVYSLEME